jgi:hypothetical protein
MKGQLHCMLSTLQSAGRSLKKKMPRVSAQMYLRATVQDGVSRIHPQLLFFAAKVQISTSESGPKYICGQRSKMAFQGYTKSILYIYKDEGLKRREKSFISFPLEILKRRRTAANFSLNFPL